jgi:hypothetical protein
MFFKTDKSRTINVFTHVLSRRRSRVYSARRGSVFNEFVDNSQTVWCSSVSHSTGTWLLAQVVELLGQLQDCKGTAAGLLRVDATPCVEATSGS